MAEITVTDEMVQAALGKLPARWSIQDLHDAIAAAIAATRPMELRFDTADLSEHELAAAALAEASDGPLLRLPSPAFWHGEHGPELPLDADGNPIMLLTDCVSSELRTGCAVVAVEELAGVSELADRLGVARSTVAGWTKRAEKIGMPAPLAELAAGPVFNLTAVEAWYRDWKSTADAPGGDDAAA